ncbi:uncharacterized protein LOC110464679 [Mizuhopecten yessoensis]|uniref:Uncharacterized protein n=1 Tax=Mizuhopecten yessoensis TaxID=6573 RepID=A0A210PTC7_MIZYE|nr:uncharacterized protein LOC110464679 [Mizuhopecten yessoensis]OWF39741.1 hypothetical protein KP79_PYT05827 [Mizuhopecten yessoensis]
MAAGTKETEIRNNDSTMVNKQLIRGQCVRGKQRQWQKDAADDCTRSNMYTKLQLVQGEHLYETLRGDNQPEFHIYDSMKVHDGQRIYCRYHGEQKALGNSCLKSNKYQEHSVPVESSTGSYLGRRAVDIDTAEQYSDTDDYETIQPVEAPTTQQLTVSTRKCMSDKQNTDVYELIWEDDNSIISPHPPKTMSSHSPSTLLKADVCKTFNSVVCSSVHCPVCVPYCPLAGPESCTSCGQKIIVQDDDSDYVEIEFETENVACNEDRVSSSDQYGSDVERLQQCSLLSRDSFCRKAFKRK